MEKMLALYTFSYKILTSEVERHIILTAKTRMKLMVMKFLGRYQNKCLLCIFFTTFLLLAHTAISLLFLSRAPSIFSPLSDV